MTGTSKTTELKTDPKGEPKAEIDELEKIMSEIEELQNELEASDAPQTAASAQSSSDADLNNEDILREMHANGLVDESNMEETLADLKSETASSSLLDESIAADAAYEDQEREMAEKPMSSSTSSPGSPNDNGGRNTAASDGTLSMTLTGNMTLKLKYEFEGQEVTISFADQALKVQMSDGTEFKVPVGSRANQNSNVKPFKKTG